MRMRTHPYDPSSSPSPSPPFLVDRTQHRPLAVKEAYSVVRLPFVALMDKDLAKLLLEVHERVDGSQVAHDRRVLGRRLQGLGWGG